MMSDQDRKFAIVLVIWTLLNLIQAGITELLDDEAYYWLFGLAPDWGYFNHPPAIGVMTFLGERFIGAEIGTRFLTVIMTSASFAMIYYVLRPKNMKLFLAIILGMSIFHVLSFITVPDVPCFFFTCIYFAFLKRFLKHRDWLSVIIIGLSVALMGYSKYQGILVVVFSLIPLFKIFKDYKVYIAMLVAALAFLPHLIWQFNNGFPTFRFHLTERMPEAYKWSFPLEYLGGQLLVFGPLIAIPIVIALYKYLPKTDFERSLKWTIVGSVAFFFLMSFRGRTEANWTSFLVLPISFLAYQYFQSKPAWHKSINVLGFTTVILICLLRVYAVVDFLPFDIRNDFHGYDTWAESVSEEAGDLPVIYYSAYQPVGKYMFYADKEAFLISMDRNSGSQHMMWRDWERRLQGKKVFNVCNGWVDCEDFDGVLEDGNKFRIIDNWRSYNYIRTSCLNPVETLKSSEEIELNILIENLLNEKVDFIGHTGDSNLIINAIVYENNTPVSVSGQALNFSYLEGLQTTQISVRLKAPEKEGSYRYSFSIEIPGLHRGKNGQFYPLVVE